MSPASSGHLEVERYIGACLISQHRSKNVTKRNDYFINTNREQQYTTASSAGECFQNNFVNLQRCNSSVVDGWAGGMPLISFANHQRRNRQHQQQINNDTTRIVEDLPPTHHQCSSSSTSSPLARLAVHTQGAPLILTKTYYYRKNKVNRNNNNNNNNNKTIDKNNKVQQNHNQNISNNDTVSVASDESSSGSTNSENCLPRIIKPRKRRKKDRKPPPLLNRPLNSSSQDGFSTDSASPDIDLTNVQTFLPLNFPFDCYLQQQQQQQHQQFLPQQQQNIYDRYHNIKYNDNSETPKLHHSFDDIKDVDDGKDINGNQPTSVCQCRYCDPSGQIWDVDRNCYSPFLTPPNDKTLTSSIQYPTTTTLLKPNYLTNNNISDNYNLICNMSALSIMDEDVVVDDDDGKKSIIQNNGPREVEVSTEIVTSLNGHRDLEIKFFQQHLVLVVKMYVQQKILIIQVIVKMIMNLLIVK